MVIIMNADATAKNIKDVIEVIEGAGLQAKVMEGEQQKIVGVIGDKTRLAAVPFDAMDGVDTTVQISKSYKLVSREFHPKSSIIDVDGVKIGGGNFVYMAGPCSVESEEQIIGIAKRVKAAGAQILRGGAFKPRTSPYSFQGMGGDGIRLLMEAKKETGLPVVTELMDISHLDLFDNVDIIQIGARNMQNFELLKEMGRVDKPILLKRGLANTIQEWLMSAEYIMAGGNHNVILCERGIRTFEKYTRNTLDLSAVSVVHGLSHLPIIVDPSHATGHAKLVEPMALGAAAVGADGLMIEVHNDPPHAKCDGAQSLTPDQFDVLTAKVAKVREAVI